MASIGKAGLHQTKVIYIVYNCIHYMLVIMLLFGKDLFITPQHGAY